MMKKVSNLDIAKRKSLLSEDNHRLLDSSTNDLFYEAARNHSKTRLYEFVSNCSFSPSLSSTYITEMIQYFNKTNDKEFIKKVDDSIVPLLNASALVEAKKVEELKESAILMERCDRILANTSKIDKETNIERYFENARGLDPDLLMYYVCECIKDFDVVTRGKVVIALETFCYLAQKNGIEYNDNYVIESAVEYYLTREDVVDMEKLDATIKKNAVADYDPNYSKSEFECVEMFKISPIKTTELLSSVLDTLINVALSKFGEALADFFDLCKMIIIASKDDDLVDSIPKKIIPSIYYKLKDTHADEREFKDYINITIQCIKNELERANFVRYHYDDIVQNRSIYYLDSLMELDEEMSSLNDMVYDKYNISNFTLTQRGDFDAYIEAGIITRDDIQNAKLKVNLLKKKIFKKENLITVIKNVDKAIASKFKEIHDKTKANFKKIKSKIFALESAENYLMEDGQFDYTISSFELQDGVINAEIQQLASEICKAVNNTELAGSDLHCYYYTTEYTLEFHIASDNLFDVSDITLNESFIDEDEIYASTILNISEAFEFEIPTEDQITEFACNNPSADYHYAMLELASIAGISRDVIDNVNTLSESYRDSEEDVEELYENYKANDYDLEIRSEALRLLSEMVLYEADIKKDSAPKQFDFNNLKLALMGLKKKVKDLGSKEQALSRNADTAFNMFMRNINKALISDRREAIIKGSVIPSFSKCIKIGIALAGLGLVTQNPIIPCIVAIGGLAASKRLTKKERTLLLDDIAVELEIIDKEIQMAESRNQMKKLRTLLKTKKELQRQYQRIKYNSRVGKELVPGSVGVGGE